MLEADFEISCAQCGGQEFEQIFPVPAETYHRYGPESLREEPHALTASVYACQQCGHLEKFIDPPAGDRSVDESV